jgi:hypothetical protein
MRAPVGLSRVGLRPDSSVGTSASPRRPRAHPAWEYRLSRDLQLNAIAVQPRGYRYRNRQGNPPCRTAVPRFQILRVAGPVPAFQVGSGSSIASAHDAIHTGIGGAPRHLFRSRAFSTNCQSTPRTPTVVQIRNLAFPRKILGVTVDETETN